MIHLLSKLYTLVQCCIFLSVWSYAVLDTHGHTLGAKDNLKKYHSRRRREEESEP